MTLPTNALRPLRAPPRCAAIVKTSTGERRPCKGKVHVWLFGKTWLCRRHLRTRTEAEGVK